MPRTEEDIVTQAPIQIVLGGQKYLVRPLFINESKEWRAKLKETLKMVSEYIGKPTDTAEGAKSILDVMLSDVPDQIVDLVFDYAKDLDREDIEKKTTDAEISKAFEQIMEVAFPLSRSMSGALKKLSQ